MTANREQEIAARLLTYVPPLIDMYLHDVVGKCIGATRTGIEVLRYFGVTAIPVAVEALACNALMVPLLDRVHDGEAIPESEIEASGGWMVAIDTEQPRVRPDGRTGWPGHLIIGVPSLGSIIDLDVVQFSRPEKQIVVPRAAGFDVSEKWWDGDLEASFPLADGGMLAYRRLLKHPPFKHTPAWRQVPTSIVGTVIRRIRSEVE